MTALSQTPQISYLTNDHLGSPRVITDASGKVIARHDYSAFGDETLTVQRTDTLGYKPDTIRQDYTGYQKDDESGLEYAQARYYNTSHGRFTSVDPLTASASIKNPQTFNRYSYVLNSPYKFTDPLGLLPAQKYKSSNGTDFSGDGTNILNTVDEIYQQWKKQQPPPPPPPSPPANSQTNSGSPAEGEPGQTATASAADPSPEPSPFPGNSLGFLDLWEAHPGKESAYVSDIAHQCAINMSYALQMVGISLSNFRGAKLDKIKSMVLALRAEELGKYLYDNAEKLFGDNYIGKMSGVYSGWTGKFDEKNETFYNVIKDKRGIVLLLQDASKSYALSAQDFSLLPLKSRVRIAEDER